ncbi:MAG: helix-turn-helix domain-containing protein [Geminicoccaceae bacterium]
MEQRFGSALKDWRRQRRMSQLDLALAADVSARHIAFLETGRSQPSRAMVIRLSDTLDVPRAQRNFLLEAAGYAPAYRRRDLDADDMAQVRAAVAWMLERHDPFPALALDRHWSIVQANRSATALLAAVGLGPGDSLLAAMIGPEGLRTALVNWPEVARHLFVRLRTESAHLGGDVVLDEVANELAREGVVEAGDPSRSLPAVIPARYRIGERVLSLFSTLTQFGTAEDIALAELTIELMFPADLETKAFLLSAGSES